jgi:hypothetical protein
VLHSEHSRYRLTVRRSYLAEKEELALLAGLDVLEQPARRTLVLLLTTLLELDVEINVLERLVCRVLYTPLAEQRTAGYELVTERRRTLLRRTSSSRTDILVSSLPTCLTGSRSGRSPAALNRA